MAVEAEFPPEDGCSTVMMNYRMRALLHALMATMYPTEAPPLSEKLILDVALYNLAADLTGEPRIILRPMPWAYPHKREELTPVEVMLVKDRMGLVAACGRFTDKSMMIVPDSPCQDKPVSQ